MLLESAQRLDAVFDEGTDAQIRPQCGQRIAQPGAQQRFVFSDDRARIVGHAITCCAGSPSRHCAGLPQFGQRGRDATGLRRAALLRDPQVRGDCLEQRLRLRGLARARVQRLTHRLQHQVVVDRRKLYLQALLGQALCLGRPFGLDGAQDFLVVSWRCSHTHTGQQADTGTTRQYKCSTIIACNGFGGVLPNPLRDRSRHRGPSPIATTAEPSRWIRHPDRDATRDGDQRHRQDRQGHHHSAEHEQRQRGDADDSCHPSHTWGRRSSGPTRPPRTPTRR